MAGVKPPFHLRVPGTGQVHPLEIATNRQLARNPQAPVQRTAAQNSAKATTSGGADGGGSINGGGSVTAGVTISTADPQPEVPGSTAVAGTTGLASDAGHIHAMPTIFPVAVQVAGSPVGTRSTLNFLTGATAVDNPGANSVDITVTGGGGSSSVFPTGGVPSVASLTWVNQGGSTAANDPIGTLTIHAPVSLDSNRMLVIATPVPPYTLTVGFLPSFPTTQAFQNIGLVAYESSSGKFVNFGYIMNSGPTINVAKWTSPTVISANYLTAVTINPSSYIYYRLFDDGTNRISSYSFDGTNFYVIHTVSRTDFCTADMVGFTVNPQNNVLDLFGTICYWSLV